MAELRRARRRLFVFVAVTLVVSFAFEAWMIKNGGLRALAGFRALVLMWIPALVSIVLRLIFREGIADVGLRAGPWRYWLLAYAVPIACAAATYGLAVATGVVAFAPKPSSLPIASPFLRWLALAGIAGVVGVLIATLYSLGEEVGWRGYMTTRLVEAKVPAPLAIGAFIWGVWHLPIIVWGDYSTSSIPALSALLFMICIGFAGVFFGWLRLAGGSMWPAVIAHSSHNVFYQGVFDAHFDGRLEPFFAGEVGVFSIAAYALVVAVLWKTGALRRAHEAPVIAVAKRAVAGAEPPSAATASDAA